MIFKAPTNPKHAVTPTLCVTTMSVPTQTRSVMRAHTSVYSHPRSRRFLPSHSRLAAILNKTWTEAGRARGFRPVAAGELEPRFVRAAPGPRVAGSSGRQGASARPALPRAWGALSAPRLVPPVTPAAAPGTQHPARGLRCGVLCRLPRRNREPEEERADLPPATRLRG